MFRNFSGFRQDKKERKMNKTTSRKLILGIQHVLAMFGATVLVPALTGLNTSITLICAGLGTLLFHLVTKRKVPVFLGSSFAFMGGIMAVIGDSRAGDPDFPAAGRLLSGSGRHGAAGHEQEKAQRD